MQVVVGEAGTGQDRHFDARQVRGDGLPPRIAQRMPAALLGEVDRQAGNAARQGLPDHREATFGDTTRRHEIAVGVGESLPGADRREVRRMQCRRLVLRERQIRHTQHAHPAVGPGWVPAHSIRS